MENNFKKTRRDFLKTTGKAGLAAALSFPVLTSSAMEGIPPEYDFPADDIGYIQTPLPYAYAAMEPVIDTMTMEIHYSRHASSYAKSLAEAVTAEGVDTKKTSLVKLLNTITKFSAKMRNNAGGHYNHEFFWKSMTTPNSSPEPGGELLKAIERDFNSLDAFKNQFSEAAKTRFGSGWAWLIVTNNKKLRIGSSANQDNPLMNLPVSKGGVTEIKGTPLLGLDVWEHAYYLKYQNRRPDYVKAWWNVVNWNIVQDRFDTR